MRKGFLACLLGLLILLIPAGAFADDGPEPTEAPVWTGRYKMWLANDAAWHQDALELGNVTTEELDGTVEIDLGLGPESRPPEADEKLHKIPFKARRSGASEPYVAEVLVGAVQPRVYRFELYPIEPGKSFVGILTMGPKRTGVLIRRD